MSRFFPSFNPFKTIQFTTQKSGFFPRFLKTSIFNLFWFEMVYFQGYNQNNAGQASCDPCPAGYYCQSKTSNPVKCPPRHYCPAATTTPITCPNGTYTNESVTGLASADQCIPCITGSYCRLGRVIGPCHGGYYCKSRSPDPNPTGIWNGIDASIAISPCPNNVTGNYSKDACSNCRTGKFCLLSKCFVIHLRNPVALSGG